MATKIVVNGREYASVDAMPEGVRRAYEQALAMLADADRNGIPDVAERGGRGSGGDVVAIHHSSITVNGRTLDGVADMPAPVRRLVEAAMSHADADRDGTPDGLLARPRGIEAAVPTLERTQGVLEIVMRIFLGVVIGVAIGGGLLIATNMSASDRSQGSVFYVGLAVLVVVGWAVSQLLWLARRRR